MDHPTSHRGNGASGGSSAARSRLLALHPPESATATPPSGTEASSSSSAPSSRLEQLVQRFEDAWHSGTRPELQRYLPDDDDTLHLPVLVELANVDLELRLKAGEAVRVETYLEQFPELGADPDVVLELIATEYELRRQRAEDVTLRDYVQRFPQYGSELSSRLQEPLLATAVSQLDPLPAAAPTGPVAVPGYEILGELGRGGMGVVYKARQVRVNRLVALKMILHGGHATPRDFARFRTEAEAVARLQHPNIVQIYEVGEADGKPFFSLEYCDGGSLAERLDEAVLPPDQAASLVETLASAVHAAHQKGIVHRDLKPANILLVSGGVVSGEWCQDETAAPATTHHSPLTTHQPKITDFGLAKKLDEVGQTASGAVMGTPSYMSPEQAFGNVRAIGPAVDIYALGAILYECLTGRPPFKGTTLWETLDQVKQHEPVSPSRLRQRLPRDLETICLKCLHKDPCKRYATAADLADDLRRWQEHVPIKARAAGRVERGFKWVRRHPARAAALAFALIAFLAVLAGGGSHLILENRRLQRLNQTQDRARGLVELAQQRVAERDFDRARLELAEARSLVANEPDLAHLHGRIDELFTAVNNRQTFLQQLDEANFHLMLLNEGPASARHEHVRQARQAAESALALAGLSVSGSEAIPHFGDRTLDEQSRRELVAGCFELWLVLAETAVHQAGEPAEPAKHALALLDRAGALGLKMASWHRRRARFLALAGDPDRAAQERKLADAVAPVHSLDWYLLGVEELQVGDVKRARSYLDRSLEQEPDRFWARYYHASCDLRLGRGDAALANLSACLTQKKDFTWAYLLRGFAYCELGELAGAEADFERAEQLLARKPDPHARYGLHINRGVLRVRQDNLDEAAREYRAAAALAPEQFQAHVNLADVYRKQADALENEPAQAQRKLTDALACLDRAIQLRPLAALHRTRARLHLRRNDDPAALLDLEQAIAQAARGGEKRSLAEDLVERGRILFRARKLADALKSCELAAEADASYLPSQRLRGETLLELQRFQDCEAALDLYLQKGGEEAVLVYRARGVARSEQGNHGGAVEDFTRALELDRLAGSGPDALTLTYRGWEYLFYDSAGLALRDFETALKLDANNGDAHNGRGFARVRLGKYREAIADAERAQALGPNTARTYYNAARTFAQAAVRAENDPAVQGAAGAVLRTHYLDGAVQRLSQALALTPAAERSAFWKQCVQSDPALAPVRRTTGFVRLAAQYTLGDR